MQVFLKALMSDHCCIATTTCAVVEPLQGHSVQAAPEARREQMFETFQEAVAKVAAARARTQRAQTSAAFAVRHSSPARSRPGSRCARHRAQTSAAFAVRHSSLAGL